MILGVPFDGGIRMMKRFGRGIAGARDGPEAILRRLKDTTYEILDLSEYQLEVTDDRRDNPIAVQEDNETIIAAHGQIQKAAERFSSEDRLISVGGDHSITYPLVKGVCKVHNDKKIGLTYIDAHFDLRPLETHVGVPGLISSGNPFFRIIEDPDIPVFPENMVAIGIHHSDTSIFW